LWDLYETSGRDIHKWYHELLSLIDLPSMNDPMGNNLDIYIGREILTRNERFMEINDTAKHANSHLAIMEKPSFF